MSVHPVTPTDSLPERVRARIAGAIVEADLLDVEWRPRFNSQDTAWAVLRHDDTRYRVPASAVTPL